MKQLALIATSLVVVALLYQLRERYLENDALVTCDCGCQRKLPRREMVIIRPKTKAVPYEYITPQCYHDLYEG